jgi:hypothetical protein
MDDGVVGHISVEHARERWLVTKVQFAEFDRSAGDYSDALKDGAFGIGEVVQNNGIVASRGELDHGV